jgi:hypothetical protein
MCLLVLLKRSITQENVRVTFLSAFAKISKYDSARSLLVN